MISCHCSEMETAVALPSLWIDWCTVTGTPALLRDETTISRFIHQAHPSRSVLKALRPAVTTRAPAWPAVLREDPSALHLLLRAGAYPSQGMSTPWPTRLRTRRLLFVAVLIAPEAQGGLGLTRAEIRSLTPHRIEAHLPGLETSADQVECVSCAVWFWLDVLGANSDWGRGGIRQLIHQRKLRTNCNRHPGTAPSAAWKDWPDFANLLPAIDRWGWVEPYSSLHPSSLSTLIGQLELLYDAPPEPADEPLPQPPAAASRISPEEEASILARAYEINARVAALLREYS